MMKYIFLTALLLQLPAKAITWNEFWQPFDNRIYVGTGCTRVVYREQYVPGNYWRRGYVKHWKERIKVPCYSED